MIQSPSAYTPLFSKLIVVPGLLLSSAISFLLTVAAAKDWSTSGTLYRVTVNSRASMQIVVHLISWLLSATQIYTIHWLLRARINLRLSRSSLNLNDLQFCLSITGSGLDLTLNRSLLMVSLFCLGISSIPSLLWAGATTPVVTTTSGGAIDFQVANYSPSTYQYWSQADVYHPNLDMQQVVHNSDGFFGYQPLYVNPGIFLTQAGLASSRNLLPQTHAKIDNTGFMYIGRSYGIGASVGLKSIDAELTSVLNIAYLENGYMSRVECLTNHSARFELVSYYDSGSAYIPNIWNVTGILPNDPRPQDWSDITDVFHDGNSTVFAILGSSLSDRFIWQIVPGKGYSMFKYMQCEVVFLPTQFQVDVDLSLKTILVTPVRKNESAFDIDTTWTIKYAAFENFLAFNEIMSIVGNAFYSNVQNVAFRNGQQDSTINRTLESGGTTDAIRHQGTAEAFESIVDNALLTFAMTQVSILNDTVPVKAIPIVRSVRVGENVYIYILFAITVFIDLLFLVELYLTRCWRKLRCFNIASVKESIVAASIGGHSISKAMTNLSECDESDKTIRSISISAHCQGQELALVSSNSEPLLSSHGLIGSSERKAPRFYLRPLERIVSQDNSGGLVSEDEIPLRSRACRLNIDRA